MFIALKGTYFFILFVCTLSLEPNDGMMDSGQTSCIQGVQRILFLRSVVLDFVKLNLFALMLLCVTQCTMWRLYFAFVNCLKHLEILSEI